MIDRISLRLSATLLLVGQLLYILVTLLHTGGGANNHHAIFASYAASTIKTQSFELGKRDYYGQ